MLDKLKKLFRKPGTKEIEFIIHEDYAHLDVLPPVPASRLVPDWYKEMPLDVKCPVTGATGHSRGKDHLTIKSCVPFLDSLTAGYIIRLPCDVIVTKTPEGPYFEWASFNVFEAHGEEQIKGMPVRLTNFQGKWNIPWYMKLPKGYSVLFKACRYHTLKNRETGADTGESIPFIAHEGIIDADHYINPVNSPFDWVDPEFEGVIPKGTPIVQVIPFKREKWKMKLLNPPPEDYKNERRNMQHKLQETTRFAYRLLWHQKKSWK